MTTRNKTFDCVEMKNRVQAQMLAEYEAHKDEYDSFVDFVKTRTQCSEWVRQTSKKTTRQPNDNA